MKIWVFLLLFVVACAPPSSQRIVSSEPSKSPLNPPIFGPNQDIYWFTSSNVGYNLVLYHDSTNQDLMRGKLINNYLNTTEATATTANWTDTFCLVMSYDNKDAKQQLRAMASSFAIQNLKDNTLERTLKMEWANKKINEDFCSGDVPTYNLYGAKVPTTTLPAFTPSELCPDCLKTIVSSYISLYKVNFTANKKPLPISESNQVPPNKFQPAKLKVSVNYFYNAPSGGNCSKQEDCIEKGMDCCIENRCVKNATEKAGSSFSPDYDQAKLDVALNPARYINYPQIFNICTVSPPIVATSTTLDPQLPILAAEQRFKTQKAQYDCMEEAKKAIPDYDAVCNDKWLCVPKWILTDPTYNGSCSTLDGKSGYDRFIEVTLEVWRLCGCKADPFPSNIEDQTLCPAYSWKPIYSSENTIQEFICKTEEIDPFLEALPKKYTLFARTAPHRFYRADNGKSVDDLTTLQKVVPEVKAEGLEFLYLDEINKTDPENDTFNINSLLGQFRVNLSDSHPALMIPVELDTSYVISVVSGELNPCPLCTKDTWEPSFFVWAPSKIGKGLEAIGFTTARNQINTNISLGNYEDTGFGRYCYLPPTMLPWSQKPEPDVNVQRRRRLLTQTALFVNGYQKDWFGFNQGAIIGSFDGVSWFAVGNLRKVTSTSTKLFLAINKPYSDLTDSNSFELLVSRDNQDVIPSTDYDNELKENDSRFNQGSSCQKWHVCETDTDCITQLGWEYTCADITKYKSAWPVFTSNADEKPNSQIAQANFNNILRDYNQIGKVKKCVYRGSGAPCKKDYLNNIKNPGLAKLLACAPNFYCAALTETSLNSRVDREPAPNNVYYYGQVTDRLGRPQYYIGGDSTFPQEAKENFKNTAIAYSKNGNTDDFGICRPGRLLITTSTPGTQPIVVSHAAKDQKGRTDFISQVASCDSSSIGNNRAITCPYFEEAVATATNYQNMAIEKTDTIVQNSQNMCGAESQYLKSGKRVSTFQIIELPRLAALSTIDQPSIVSDACLRRAGSVCHTNLDCGPNELHEQQAFSFGPTFFGGTSAEMEFWRESLICGQGQLQPALIPVASTLTTQEDPYFINKNRCCRNIGLEFTMYTQYNRAANDPDLIPDIDPVNLGLEVLKYPYLNPAAPNRYSRYAITQPLEYTVGHAAEPVDQAPILYASAGKPLTPKEYQWKTINDTGKKTCCGAGFVRLYADGTHTWAKTNRLPLFISGFSCLNYQDTLVFKRPLQVNQLNYNKEYSYLCLSPAANGIPATDTGPPPLPGLQKNVNQGIYGCSQVPILQPNTQEITLPWDLSLSEAKISTVPDEKPAGTVVQEKTLSSRAPYIPQPFLNTVPITQDDPAPTYFPNQFAPAQSVYLPVYVGGRRNIIKVTTSYYLDNEAIETDVLLTEATATTCDSISQNPLKDLPENTWCIQNSTYTAGYDVLHVHGAEKPNGKDWGYGGFTIYFNTINSKTYDYCYDNIKNLSTGVKPPCLPNFDDDPMKPTDIGNIQTVGMGAGNALYYLTKLSRLELLGIPQIFYEPIYCNSNRDDLVPGIFNINPQTREQFETQGFQYDPITNAIALFNIYNQDIPNYATDFANPDSYVTMQDLISIPRVFSGHKFICCKNLGTQVLNNKECCSEFSTADAQGRRICKLPRGADLHVYFNRFVSGDGVGDFQPGGGLLDTDFIPETGEPNLTKEVSNKISALGVAYCASGAVRWGAAFGYFYAQPNNGFFTQTSKVEDNSFYSIIDSSQDYQGEPGDTISGTGAIRYLEGYRWNHHLYCAPQ